MIKYNLLEGDIKKHMVRLALPNIGGMLAIILFNITDTFFVSKLGVKPLAAMGFTFPVVMVVGAFSSGISMGAGSILARAFGKQDTHLMKRIATDGILLAVLSVVFISSLGIITIPGLFKLLGAEADIIPLIKEYMIVWYGGVIFFIMPPVSDSCMRAIGDMRRPFYVMLVCAIGNFILDPIFIFNEFTIFGITIHGLNLGIKGAALATMIARGFGGLLSLSFVNFKYNLISFKYESPLELINSWRNILSIGIPGALIRLLPQLVRATLTKLTAVVGGTYAVAAIAAGSRIESFSQVISMAVGASLIPIMGQNFGAGNHDRVEESRKIILKISIIYGIILTILAIIFGKPLSLIFTKNQEVINYMNVYLIIMMTGSVGLNLYNWLSEGLVALGKAKLSLKINLFGSLFILIPLLLLGSRIGEFKGMLVGLILGQIILGITAEILVKKEINRTI
ncbi:MAG: MATE family efflux transporter [Spirochaetales bacterium]|nr:MATE family efflux transporter [Spirochaetales bacterium]